ncbi:MAG: lipid-binding SYLF domain-containing protein [Desulfobacterales bacterium]
MVSERPAAADTVTGDQPRSGAPSGPLTEAGRPNGHPYQLLLESTMRFFGPLLLPVVLVLLPLTASAQQVRDYSETISLFKSSPEVRWFFDNSYGYAVFPVVGKAAFIIGGAYGEGQVYRNRRVTGTTNLVHGSIGFQWGGQAFSQIIFFRDQRAYNDFTRGQFEFDAQASAVAVTAGAQARASTVGTSASATAGPRTGAQAMTSYASNGMAVFVYAKGGLMAELSIGGQKFNFYPL